MTQNTQTTRERIAVLIFSAIRADPTTLIVVGEACVTIAAEIDALTAERDDARAALATMNADRCEILREFGELQGREARATRELSEARAEIDRLRPAAEAWEKAEQVRAREHEERKAAFGEDFALASFLLDIAKEEAATAAARAAKVTP